MNLDRLRHWSALCCLLMAAPAFGATVTIQVSGTAPYQLESQVWLLPKLDGVGKSMMLSVNGIRGGNATVGTVNEQNGEYRAPAVMPEAKSVVITATTYTAPYDSGSVTIALKLQTPTIATITPTLLTCGQPYTLTVTGIRYVPQSVVWINRAAAPTTYVSPTTLKATGLASQGGSTVSVKVINVINGESAEDYRVKVGTCTTTTTTPPPTTTTPPPPTTTTPPRIGLQPAADPAQIAAVRLLEQASFGASPADVANARALGANAWLAQQLTLPASPLPLTTDMTALRNNWYRNMASGPDQLRQRMIFALSQIFVVSADKNPYANEIQPWLLTLSKHAFGNYGDLLREMTLNPAMGKYLDLGNSITPSPNENYAREVMQLFTIGATLLNQDGSVQLDRYGDPLPAYDQARIADISRALSGWTYAGTNATGINWENFSGPLQPRDNYHDKRAKLLLNGISVPAGQTTVQDYNAVMDNLFQHPNLPPFVAVRLIRHFVTSNPSPAYIARVADVFANGGNGRGDLAATLQAVLLDPEARSATPAATDGHLKDPMLHTLGLLRALNGTVVDPTNMFWDYLLIGQKIINAPSVFNFYSPLTRLPGAPQYNGPEFQIYPPSLAVARANLVFGLLNGQYAGALKIDITPYVTAAADPTALLNLVDATLLAGRMTPTARAAIGAAVQATSDNKQRALTALYLTAISGEFAAVK
ncbi:MAG: DUF1800 domain-containing protein [Massilia sp.]